MNVVLGAIVVVAGAALLVVEISAGESKPSIAYLLGFLLTAMGFVTILAQQFQEMWLAAPVRRQTRPYEE